MGHCVEYLLAKPASCDHQQASNNLESVIKDAIARTQAASDTAQDVRVKLMEGMRQTPDVHIAQVDSKLKQWKKELEQSLKSVQDDLYVFKPEKVDWFIFIACFLNPIVVEVSPARQLLLNELCPFHWEAGVKILLFNR